MKKQLILLLSVAVFATACQLFKKQPEHGDALLEVAGHFLYAEDVAQIIPPNSTPDDSARIADNFVRRWVTDALLYDKAQHNIGDTRQIDQMVEEYRKLLMIYAYEQQIVNQRMGKNVPDNDLHNFYEQYADEMPLTESVLKGVLLVLPVNAPDLAKVRGWMRKADDESLNNIETYALRSSLGYMFFSDQWTPWTDIAKYLPATANVQAETLRSTPLLEIADSANVALLHIDDVRHAGESKPFELAKTDMQTILFNKQKIDFLQEFETSLYNDAVADGTVNWIDMDKKQ